MSIILATLMSLCPDAALASNTVREQVRANRALQLCRRTERRLPSTLAEFHNQSRRVASEDVRIMFKDFESVTMSPER